MTLTAILLAVTGGTVQVFGILIAYRIGHGTGFERGWNLGRASGFDLGVSEGEKYARTGKIKALEDH